MKSQNKRHVVVLIGPQRSGKTSYICKRMQEHSTFRTWYGSFLNVNFALLSGLELVAIDDIPGAAAVDQVIADIHTQGEEGCTYLLSTQDPGAFDPRRNLNYITF